MAKPRPGRTHAFPNGSSYTAWEEGNCCRCAKAVFDPEEPITCKLQNALMDAMMDDGTVKKSVVIQIGLRTADGKQGDYCCKEFELKKGELPDELQNIMDQCERMFDFVFGMKDVPRPDKQRFLRRLAKRSNYLLSVLKKNGGK